jgi:glycine cleavage system aminomethyltransferase T
MLRGGAQRLGTEVSVYHLGQHFAARVVSPLFLDPGGERLRG